MSAILPIALAVAALGPPRPSFLSDTAFCDAIGALPEGPIQGALLPGALGTGRPTCARHAVGAGIGLGLTVDLPRFYGALGAAFQFSGRLRVHRRVEVFADVELLRYDRVIAPFSADAVGFGTTSVGATAMILERPRGALSARTRVVFPTATGLHPNTAPFGFDLGLFAATTPVAPLLLRIDLGVLGSAVAGPGPDLPRFGLTVTGGAELRPVRGFGFAADLHARFGYDAPLGALAAGLGLRFSDDRRFGFEVGVTLPFAGRERRTVVAGLRGTVQLGPVAERPPHP